MELTIALQCPKCSNWIVVPVEISPNTKARKMDYGRSHYMVSNLTFPVSFVCEVDHPCSDSTNCGNTIHTTVTMIPQMGPIFVQDNTGEVSVVPAKEQK